MDTDNLTTTATEIAKFKNKVDATTRYLLSESELVLENNTLEIFPNKRLILGRLYNKCERLGRVGDSLGLNVVIKSPYTFPFYLN